MEDCLSSKSGFLALLESTNNLMIPLPHNQFTKLPIYLMTQLPLFLG